MNTIDLQIVKYINDNFSQTPDYLTVFPEAVFPSTDIRNTDAEEQLLAMFRN